jgi:hypothetical protein
MRLPNAKPQAVKGNTISQYAAYLRGAVVDYRGFGCDITTGLHHVAPPQSDPMLSIESALISLDTAKRGEAVLRMIDLLPKDRKSEILSNLGKELISRQDTTIPTVVMGLLHEIADGLRNRNIVAFSELKSEVSNIFPEMAEDGGDSLKQRHEPTLLWPKTMRRINNPDYDEE